jgi:serine/threonine protein phosphatase 1
MDSREPRAAAGEVTMRELVIGDIHGCARAFRTLLERLAPTPEDTVILLGDYIDRGPASCEVVDMVLKLGMRCTVIALSGNHEKMLLDARLKPDVKSGWLFHGGEETLASYARGGYGGTLDDIPDWHWEFFEEQTLDYWETEERIYVHGALDPSLDMEDQPAWLLFWERFSDPLVHKSGKQIICGHASQKDGLPRVFDGGICLDSCVYGTGWLTCLDARRQTFLQANEDGRVREFDVARLLREREAIV